MTVENAMACSSQEKGNCRTIFLHVILTTITVFILFCGAPSTWARISAFYSGQSNGTVISYLQSVVKTLRPALLPRERYCQAF